MIFSIIYFFIDALFPEKCRGCGKDGSILCQNCLETRVERATTDGLPEHTQALFRYKDKLFSQALWKFKYTGNRALANTFASALANELTSELYAIRQFSGNKNILIVSIPSSKSRVRRFGFNQSAVLARALTNTSGYFLHADILERTRTAPRQATLKNRRERLRNMDGMFKIKNPEIVAGKSVIVVDDVTTTGATITAAIKAIKAAGATSARGLTLSH